MALIQVTPEVLNSKATESAISAASTTTQWRGSAHWFLR